MELAAPGARDRWPGAMGLSPSQILVEQLGKLVGHDAGEFLGVCHSHGATVVAGHVMADADG